MMYDELIKRLRISCESCKLWDGYKCCLKGECSAQKSLQAADAIEELCVTVRNLVAVIDEWAEELKKHRWIPVTERLPEADVAVLARYEYTNSNGKKWTYTCRASYIPKFTVLIEDKWNDCDGSWEDYNEDDDSFYVPEGWYEETSEGNGDGMSWFINATVTHWMPLPKLPEREGKT